ncbi:leucine-rich repeat domain-containing protein [Candidatus Gracilibacteria bacterium]|nr:leucine-rich repeat domain-containing protein [Candidatus Gracilibacteria bacterium]
MRELDNIGKKSGGGGLCIIYKKAFTLVELVIVIIIIGILATMGFVTYNKQRNLARDVVRESDLRSIAQILETSLTQGEFLREAIKDRLPNPDPDATGTTKEETIRGKKFTIGYFGTTAKTKYDGQMSVFPADPSTREPYIYGKSEDGESFFLAAELEVGKKYILSNFGLESESGLALVTPGKAPEIGNVTPPPSKQPETPSPSQPEPPKQPETPKEPEKPKPKTPEIPKLQEPSKHDRHMDCLTFQRMGAKQVVTGFSSTVKDNCRQNLVIPESKDGYPVTDINARAFLGQTGVQSVYGPNIETIGEYAFYNTSGMSRITFPKVKTVGNGAFSHNIQLTVVNMPSATTIGEGAFAYAYNLEEIYLKEATTIGNYAFTSSYTYYNGSASYQNRKGSITKVTLPKVKNIGTQAFRSNNIGPGKENISLGLETDGNITIGDYAFLDNNIVSLEGVASPYEIGPGAFKDNKITAVDFSKTKYIRDSAFYNNNLETIDLGTKLTNIGDYAFYENSINSITFPSQLNSVGSSAFAQQRNIQPPIKVVDKYSAVSRERANGAFNQQIDYKRER